MFFFFNSFNIFALDFCPTITIHWQNRKGIILPLSDKLVLLVFIGFKMKICNILQTLKKMGSNHIWNFFNGRADLPPPPGFQWWAIIIKWTRANIYIWMPHYVQNEYPNKFGWSIFTEQISKYICIPDIAQIRIWIIFEGHFIRILEYSYSSLIEAIF